MKEKQYVSTMTSKGQVTIPAAVRRMLKLEPNAAVAFEVRGDEVRIKPARLALESIYGAVKPLTSPEDFERLEQIAGEERAGHLSGAQRHADAIR